MIVGASTDSPLVREASFLDFFGLERRFLFRAEDGFTFGALLDTVSNEGDVVVAEEVSTGDEEDAVDTGTTFGGPELRGLVFFVGFVVNDTEPLAFFEGVLDTKVRLIPNAMSRNDGGDPA